MRQKSVKTRNTKILNCKEIFAVLVKERTRRNAKGDFISMGCPYSVYLAHKDEIDTECERKNNEARK